MRDTTRLVAMWCATTVCVAGAAIPTEALAETTDTGIQDQLRKIANEIEAASDAIMVTSTAFTKALPTTQNSNGALSEYYESLRQEHQSITAEGGVTVLDTTADIRLVSRSSSGASVDGELHVTRTVAELPEGESWEEVLPITLRRDADGNLSVAEIMTQASVAARQEVDATDRAQTTLGNTGATFDRHANASAPELQPTAVRLNKMKAIAYAKKWWNKKNPTYPTRYTNDCTNFVSQVMHQGGWPPVPGWYKSNKAWWYRGIPAGSYTWGGAESFYRFAVRERKRATPLRNIADLWLGDILQYKVRGKSSMSHTMVVTNWINKVPYLTYHTHNTLNKPFTAMAKMKVTWFASRT
ncbi:amidase domain-containing protein [uncultured Tessaracoccus sp.]|uniref:amidase domain-containing protein n=1 Tax=uncultured Tessaracoccus sp. TaxID=905023 RepID=UPI0025E8068B|nr:amidase domain-containing protein [uncultured Tessaracoccus sp.]